MKNNYYLLLLFAAFCCMGVQCKEEEPDKTEELAKLPPATTKGRNTFGCLINGKAFPQSSEGYHEKQCDYYFNKFYLSYSTNFSQFNINTFISIMSKKIKTEGLFMIGLTNPSEEFVQVHYEDENYSSNNQFNINNYAKINISRFDTANNIVSGTFSFKLKNDSGNKEVSVEHGRFDYQYQ
ncbi:MAG: hypothetical protein WC150_07020 [Bacteroidia bacterium]